MTDPFESSEPRPLSSALAEYRRDKQQRRARADNALFAIACAIVAALFCLAWWMLP